MRGFEFQERGTIHAHFLLWLHGAPDLERATVAMAAELASIPNVHAQPRPIHMDTPQSNDVLAFCESQVNMWNLLGAAGAGGGLNEIATRPSRPSHASATCWKPRPAPAPRRTPSAS